MVPLTFDFHPDGARYGILSNNVIRLMDQRSAFFFSRLLWFDWCGVSVAKVACWSQQSSKFVTARKSNQISADWKTAQHFPPCFGNYLRARKRNTVCGIQIASASMNTYRDKSSRLLLNWSFFLYFYINIGKVYFILKQLIVPSSLFRQLFASKKKLVIWIPHAVTKNP